MAIKNRVGDVLREIVLAALGIILVLSLPAIWVAWTGTMLIGIVVTGVLSGVIYCLLHAFHDKNRDPRPDPFYSTWKPILNDQFIAEVQSLYPMIYHHRSIDDPGFQRKME